MSNEPEYEDNLNYAETEPTEAEKVASQMTTRDYFLSEEERLLDEFGTRSLELFKFTG